MTLVRFLAGLAMLSLLAACASEPPSKFRSYDGSEVTQIRVYKAERVMELWHHDTLLRSFAVDLGYPNGHKQRRGDRRTPEGSYHIDRRNPNSRFHLSLGISYPSAEDIAAARARGEDPGDNIFIHGRGPEFANARGDWTDGCIAVTDREMEDIYAMVRTGTPIEIAPARPAPAPFVKEPMLVGVEAVPAGEVPAAEPTTDPAPETAPDPAPETAPETALPVAEVAEPEDLASLLPAQY